MTALSDLILLVRERSNMENNFFVSDAELTVYINNSLAELDDILITAYEDYRVQPYLAVLPGDGSNNIISIPSNFYKLRGVDFNLNQGANVPNQYITVYEYQMPERNRYSNIGGNAQFMAGVLGLKYRLTDTGIVIQPNTQCGGTYQVWYVPKFRPLVNPTDQLSIQMDTQGWIEYAVVDCCIKIFDKQNMDSASFALAKAALQHRIVGASKNRDAASPKRVVDVRYHNDMYGLDGLYGNYGGW